jgi:hypothetical protein
MVGLLSLQHCRLASSDACFSPLPYEQSSSAASSSVAGRPAAAPAASDRPNGASAVRCVAWQASLAWSRRHSWWSRLHQQLNSLARLSSSCSRRAQAAKPLSTRAAGAGGSSQTMLRLYTSDGEGGLKVYVFFFYSMVPLTGCQLAVRSTWALAQRRCPEPTLAARTLTDGLASFLTPDSLSATLSSSSSSLSPSLPPSSSSTSRPRSSVRSPSKRARLASFAGRTSHDCTPVVDHKPLLSLQRSRRPHAQNGRGRTYILYRFA